MSEKQEFLYKSIADIQSTIRTIDTKISLLLVVLFIPLTKLGSIYFKVKSILNSNENFILILGGFICFVFPILWVSSIILTFKTLMPFDDLKKHIAGDKPNSLFYPANLYEFSFWDIFFKSTALSSLKFEAYFKALPHKGSSINKQLALEQMKLMYISSLKIKRSQYAYICTVVWMISGGLLWLIYLIHN